MKPIRIVATPDEPYIYDCFTEYPTKCSKPGFEIEYIHTVLATIMNINVEYVSVENFGETRNALHTGRADVLGTSTSIHQSYMEHYYSSPIAYWDSIGLIVKETLKQDNEFFNIFKPFTYQLWLILIFTCVAAVSFVGLSSFLLDKQKSGKVKYPQGLKLVCTFWFIAVNMILNLYSNLIAVDMATSSKVPGAPFENLQDLGQKLIAGQCKLVTLKKYEHELDIHKSFINPSQQAELDDQNSWKNYFNKAFVENPPVYLDDRYKLIDLVQNSTCIIGVDYATLAPFYESRFCHIKLLTFPDQLKPIPYVYYYTEKMLTANFSVILTPSVQFYPQYLAKMYFHSKSPMEPCHNTSSKQDNSLELENFEGVFILFISALIFVILFQILHATVLTNRIAYSGGLILNDV